MARYALIIGINQYEDRDRIQPLRYAVKDATRVSAFFEGCGYQVDSLIATDATGKAIQQKLKQVSDILKPEDIFLFYFSGHGYQSERSHDQTQYLLPQDVNLWALEQDGIGAIPVRFIEKSTSHVIGVQRAVVLDACRGPLSPHRGTDDQSAQYSGRDIGTVIKDAPVRSPLVIVCSCHPGQKAYEFEDLQGGIFTSAMLRVFENCRKRKVSISFSDLTNTSIAKEAVRLLKERKTISGEYQEPWISGSISGVVLVETEVTIPSVFPTKQEEPSTVITRGDEFEIRSRLKGFVNERNANWDKNDFMDLLAQLHDEEVSMGWRRDEIEKLLNEEKVKWVKVEAERKAEQARLAKEALERAEEAKRKVKEAEDARALAEEEELWRRCRAAGTEESLLEYLRLSKIKKYETEAKERLPLPPVPQVFTNSISMKFVLIKAGTFLMGSPNDEKGRSSDETQHEVTITKPFYMGVTEVTRGQFISFVEGRKGKGIVKVKDCLSKDHDWENPGFEQTDEHPVVYVSWDDAVAFCEWLSGKEGKQYRLPTEAEWEYACRSGSQTRYSFGDDEGKLGEYAWYSGNSGSKTHPVGQKKPNAWGLYDIHGNVWEWCNDWHEEYPKGDVTDPKGPDRGSDWVGRGGSWNWDPEAVRSAYRCRRWFDYRDNGFGFRCARTP